VVYAALTDAGLEKLSAAAAVHFAQVDDVFGARYEENELSELSALLARLAEGDVGGCEIPA
jgi:hypothetical protein